MKNRTRVLLNLAVSAFLFLVFVQGTSFLVDVYKMSFGGVIWYLVWTVSALVFTGSILSAVMSVFYALRAFKLSRHTS